MLAFISAAISAVTEGLKLANTQASRKYVDKLATLKLKILAEEDHGYYSDDAKLESLYKELKIIMETAEHEIRLAQAQPS